MKMRVMLLLALGIAVSLLAGIAYAQGEQAISRWWIGAGGGQATGGNVAVSAAVGQAVAGSASGGGLTLCSGFWCGGRTGERLLSIFLPTIPKYLYWYAPDCSAANNYCEENDNPGTAWGPLAPGREYRAYPDDQNDYYSIQVNVSGSLDCRVSGYQAEGQLIVYDADDMSVVGSDFNNAGGDGVMQVAVAGLPPGKYYVRIYTASGFNTSSLYTLRVTW